MSYQLKVEKLIAKPTTEVFRALSEGRLFMNCSADSGKMKIDFRVGGSYLLDFKGKKNWGEFTEIVPNKKIAFTWCQTFAPDQKPDTQVTIELHGDGPKTRVVVMHTGFKDQGVCDGHIQGWTGGLDDLTQELEQGTLRMVRRFDASTEKLFENCQGLLFFGCMGDLAKGTVDFKVGGSYQIPTKTGQVRGEFLEIVPNRKIVFSWLEGCDGPLAQSRVELNINPREGNRAALELLHYGLPTEHEQMSHRAGWESITNEMGKALGVY